MLELEPFFQHGQGVLVVAFRLSGLLIFSPVLAGAAIPESAKVFLVLTFAAAFYPCLDTSWHQPQVFSLLTLGQLMVTEVLIGSAIGLVASLPIVGIQLGGQIMGQQMGMGLAQIFNPEFDTNTGVVDQLLFYAALAVFISFGGLEAVFVAMMNTFDRVPLGAMTLQAVPLELLVGAIQSGFELAVRVAAPVLAIMLIETVASALLARSIPQINLLSIGFAVKIVAGLGVLAAAGATLFEVFAEESDSVLRQLIAWAGLVLGVA